MMASSIEQTRLHAARALERYWPNRAEAILELPIPIASQSESQPLPPHLEMVELPEWARDLGVEGKILIPLHCMAERGVPLWRQVDWLGAVQWYLNGESERAFERKNGPIHSYSFRLKGWDGRMWERAWVNRIALFLRRWAARELDASEESVFGPLPEAEVILTHDVDAVRKTWAIRFKQAAFNAFNAARLLLEGRLGASMARLGRAFHFLVGCDNFWHFPAILELERRRGLKSRFYFYGGGCGGRRSFKQMLFDPAYPVDSPKLKQVLGELSSGGWPIGLHQSFDAWQDAELMRGERARLEKALGRPVNSCRQHWLRFSWDRTWAAQQEAGFVSDSTLGFNDRPGFRNGAALRFQPYGADGMPMKLEAIPMVLMDSHLYDYAQLSEVEREEQIRYWVDEVRQVRGVATFLWHQQVFGKDYGWGPGYEKLISILQ